MSLNLIGAVEIFDVEEFSKVMAFEIMSGQWDGATAGNNYYIYYNVVSSKMEFWRYDYDASLGALSEIQPLIDKCVFDWANGTTEPLVLRLMSIPSFVDLVAEKIWRLLDTGYDGSPDSLWTLRGKAYLNMLSYLVPQDRWWRIDTAYSMQDFHNSWNSTLIREPVLPLEAASAHIIGIGQFLERRSSTARAQLLGKDPSCTPVSAS